VYMNKTHYTKQEVHDLKPLKQVPQFYLNRYPNATYDEYVEDLHEFLNGQ